MQILRQSNTTNENSEKITNENVDNKYSNKSEFKTYFSLTAYLNNLFNFKDDFALAKPATRTISINSDRIIF